MKVGIGWDTTMTYTAYIDSPNGLREFENIRQATLVPTGVVHLETDNGARLKIDGGEIIRLKHEDEASDD